MFYIECQSGIQNEWHSKSVISSHRYSSVATLLESLAKRHYSDMLHP
jgi:hypothetical protein